MRLLKAELPLLLLPRYHKGFLIIAPNYNRQSLAYTHMRVRVCVFVFAQTQIAYTPWHFETKATTMRSCVWQKDFGWLQWIVPAHPPTPTLTPSHATPTQPLAGSVF